MLTRSRTELAKNPPRAHQYSCSALPFPRSPRDHSYSPGVPWFGPGRLGEQGPSNHSLTRTTASAYEILEQLRRGASSRRPPVSVRGSYLLESAAWKTP
ncbi:hypothetical protein CGRA01v4_07565 [Colletotrichum graminicola]|nr:hypothetical protein CGRA01v4_07565 [Colletotrichum graminicola]